MKSIYIETKRVKGGKSQTKEVGFLSVGLRHNQDTINIDDYEGFGSSYKQREMQLIEVYENGKLLFSGNKYELFAILKGE
jgi:hypothetical protein